MGQGSGRSEEAAALLHPTKSKEPMFFAALAEVHAGLKPNEGDGFVIITAASDQGMVDIHDRRPVVFTPERAREWVERGLGREKVEELAMHCCQPTAAFEWFPVGNAVGNSNKQGAELLQPKQ